MARLTPVPLNFQEANNFADWNGIKRDLEWIIMMGPKYPDYKKELNLDLTEVLFIALVVKYARVHMTGERKRIPQKWINCLSKKDQEVHTYIMAVRNKYIAHSVNNFEENFAVAYIKDISSEKPEFTQVQVQQTRVLAISEEEISSLIKLAEILLKQVNDLIVEEKKKLTDIVKNLDLKDYIHNKRKPTSSSWSEAGKSRSRKLSQRNK